MRKIVAIAISMVGLLAFASLVYAQTGIVNTKHNLRSSGTSALKGTTDEICIYCHTPHGGKKAITDDTGPLWNRAYTPGTFQVYASYTLDTAPSATPTSVSKACLSCHDGTLGLNQLINNAGPGSGSNPATDPNPIGGASSTNNMALIGTDLRDDHPVSIIYANAKSYGTGTATVGEDSHAAGFRAATTSGTRPIVVNGSVTLPLYGTDTATGKVECASCHDPHEERSKTGATDPTKSVYFLRIANDGSQLCLTCHLK